MRHFNGLSRFSDPIYAHATEVLGPSPEIAAIVTQHAVQGALAVIKAGLDREPEDLIRDLVDTATYD